MIRTLRLTSLAALIFTVSAQAGAPATMRLDYFHSGNKDAEMFSFDQLVIEPLPWTGNMKQPIDENAAWQVSF